MIYFLVVISLAQTTIVSADLFSSGEGLHSSVAAPLTSLVGLVKGLFAPT